MAWKKANRDLIDLLEKSLQDRKCDRRVMFGSPTFFVNNNMFAGVHEDTVIMRLSEADRNELISSNDEIGLFEPAKGRPMKEYAAVPESFCQDTVFFMKWLDRSYAYAASLPPKPVKKKK